MERERILDKVAKLLAQAEGTDNQHEIDTFLAKAHEMMAKHSLKLHELKRTSQPEKIIQREIIIGLQNSPIASTKGSLAVCICDHNRCQVIRKNPIKDGKKLYALEFIGFESDVDFTEMLFQSLCLQMEEAHNREKANKRSFVHASTFRSNFTNGFIEEANLRLQKISDKTTQVIETAKTGNALVLVEKSDQVRKHFRALYPNLTRSYGGQTNYDGHAAQAGRRAARQADYSGHVKKRITGA